MNPERVDGDAVRLAVVGAHLTGQPLNHELTERGAQLVETTVTAPHYRLFALETRPPKPGLVRVDDLERGVSIEVEVWGLTVSAFGSFVAAVPRPLGIGKVELLDGREVCGFMCETVAIGGSCDISSFGGWRAYLARD